MRASTCPAGSQTKYSIWLLQRNVSVPDHAPFCSVATDELLMQGVSLVELRYVQVKSHTAYRPQLRARQYLASWLPGHTAARRLPRHSLTPNCQWSSRPMRLHAHLGVSGSSSSVCAKSPLQCAGINRHEAGNERVLRERSSEPLGPEFCVAHREVCGEA
jgi:hypothetical protein